MVIIENRPPNMVGHRRITTTSCGLHGGAFSFHDGTGSPEQRIREQGQDGVDAEIMYTDLYSPVFLTMVASQDGVDAEMMYTHPIFAGFWRGVREDEGYKALIRAYNEFLAEEYCAAYPSRLIAMGVIPDTGVNDAIDEVEHCGRAGLKGVALHRFPSGKGYPTLEDDRFWQTTLDLQMPVTFLARGRTTTLRPESPLLLDPRHTVNSPVRRDPVSPLPRFAGGPPFAPLQMAHAGVFDRFPQLRIYWAGSQAGWLSYSLSHIDDNYERNRYWGERFYVMEPIAHPPSYYLETHCLWGFMNDPYAVRMRHDVGVGPLIWGSGFAHATGDSLHPGDVIERCFAGVPDEERYRMLAGNVIEFFHIEDEIV
jgi:predicted TIM-barrel fold metal-dependent hydrolase